MKRKIIITGALMIAFLAGYTVNGYFKWAPDLASSAATSRVNFSDMKEGLHDNFVTPTISTNTGLFSDEIRALPAAETWNKPRVLRIADTETSDPGRPIFNRRRTWQREALIIGGGAGAGALIGGVAGGKKGAVVGALSGAAAGTIYDLATRNKRSSNRQRSF